MFVQNEGARERAIFPERGEFSVRADKYTGLRLLDMCDGWVCLLFRCQKRADKGTREGDCEED